MKNEFLIAITQLSAEKNLPREVVLEAVEAALVSAFKKENGLGQNISVKINPTTGDVRLYQQLAVVEEVTDPRSEVTLPEALTMDPAAELGGFVSKETAVKNAGRIAAQTAKQVVMQRLREAEREIVYEEFQDKEGDIVSGIVQRMEPKQIIIDLGKTEAVLPAAEQVKTEHYRMGQRLKVYLTEVFRTNKGPQVIVSRTHRNLLRRLFELEVPEIFNGVVEIKAIAREPGYRSKVAVAARQEGVDAVGSCVGLRGIRIMNITNELNNEKVDVIQWAPDPGVFVANALSPAQVMHVDINETDKTATVIVPDRQLSLAIGKEGQNARLAAKLTGWRIDIKSAGSVEADRLERLRAAFAAPIIRESDVAAVLDTPPAPLPPLIPEREPVTAVEPAPAMAEAAPVETEVLAPVAEAPAPAPAVAAVPVAESVEASVAVTVAPAAPDAPAAAISQRPPAQGAGDGQRIRFAEDLSERERRGGQSRTKRELEDAEKAARTQKKKVRTTVRPTSEEDDEVEAYDDILRRLKR
ncbi:MAG: transcription termination factor NusA [Chloroflexi bacterium]|nr:transcription termination factor NusA [Chloroflexota bacterium]